MIRFTLRQLSYFVAAAEGGSTLRGSQTLNVSQPAVSMAIGQLEQTFRQNLFVRRHAQGVVLTAFGRRKLAEARHLLAHAAAVGAPDDDAGLEGELEIGVFSTLAPVFAPGILSDFCIAHPGVNVRMRESNLDQLHRDLDSGIIEVALLYDLDLAENVTCTPLGEFMPYVLLPQAHPLCAEDSVSLHDVAAEAYILIDLPYSRDYFLSLFRVIGEMPSKVLRCSSLETVRGMVAHGMGLSTLVTRPAGDLSYDGKPLVCRPIRETVPPQRAIVAFSPRSPLTKIAQAFVEVSQAYFARLPQTAEFRQDRVALSKISV
jgi:DNA-binding transcriptional LysR family regulator